MYAFHYEYRWSVYERGIIEGTSPVTCDIDGPIDEPIDEPTGDPADPGDPDRRADHGGRRRRRRQTPAHARHHHAGWPMCLAAHTPKQLRAAAAVPTTIDAGL